MLSWKNFFDGDNDYGFEDRGFSASNAMADSIKP